jgi:predicted RNase H-like nuclease
LPCKTYNEARRFGLSQQGFAIVPKIREVDELMTAAMQDEILESHPELAFTGLAGAPMAFNKKKRAGREERLEALKLARELAPCRLLAQVDELLKTERERFSRRDVATDDIVDAYAMLNVAARIAAGVARRVPTAPPLDRRGLRMEMWY